MLFTPMRRKKPDDARRKAMAVLNQAAALGYKLQQEHPEIFEALSDPELGQRDILKRLRLGTEYSHSLDILVRALEFGARGNPYTRLDTPPYEGMLSAEECTHLFHERRRSVGRRTLAERKGIHNLTQEEMSEHGKSLHRRRIGIHSYSTEKRKAVGSMGGKASAAATGKHQWYGESPYEPSPLRSLKEMANDPAFTYEGPKQRRIRAAMIAEELSSQFPEQAPFTVREVIAAHHDWKEYDLEKTISYDVMSRLGILVK